MQLKMQTNCAIRILVYLGSERRRQANNKEIAFALNVNETYLPKLLRTMCNVGWLHSTTGADGGYMLLKDPATITLWDVMNVTEDTMFIDRSLEATEDKRAAADPTKAHYMRLQAIIETYAADVTIQDIIDRNETANS